MLLLSNIKGLAFSKFKVSLVLLSPSKKPPRSITNSFAITLPKSLPLGKTSTIFESILPVKAPLIITLSACTSPFTSPDFPIVTFFCERTIPSYSPSICKLHSISISPLILVPAAIIVVPEALILGLLDLSLGLLKIAILYVSPF